MGMFDAKPEGFSVTLSEKIQKQFHMKVFFFVGQHWIMRISYSLTQYTWMREYYIKIGFATVLFSCLQVCFSTVIRNQLIKAKQTSKKDFTFAYFQGQK